ncbi:lyase family protein [Caenimonas soli]|uniref:lyase family protein n=1 Tax=Caenimonas soli TaxID=2735555 RepID=UPI001555430D|nr:lyase family protein [Caenimonas soli]NPC56789.1 3-carboxy-cis,cis-muconate cycloisomerase [Caenimonas soli]
MASIFESFLSTPEALDAFAERGFVAAMLRFEAALARAQAACGLVPKTAADAIAGCCALERFDVQAIARDSARAGSVAIPLVKALKELVAQADPQALAFVHFGSTSQDVIDSANALVTRGVLELVEVDLDRAIEALLALAERHAGAPMLARTLAQPASVTSFGWKCAQWAAPLVRCRGRLRTTAAQALAVQLGGAVGTQAQMQGKGPEVARLVAKELGLAAPSAAWHTQRDAWVALACDLGLMVGSLGKIAKDLSLLGQWEVGEVSEPSELGRGGSSAMPHKRNPVAAMVALAAAHRVPHHVAALLAAMPQEHERALGAWQAELAEWPLLWSAAHGSVRALAQALPGLQVDTDRMLVNLERLRAELPPQAAQEWFDPALADHAAGLARAQVAALRAQLKEMA